MIDPFFKRIGFLPMLDPQTPHRIFSEPFFILLSWYFDSLIFVFPTLILRAIFCTPYFKTINLTKILPR